MRPRHLEGCHSRLRQAGRKSPRRLAERPGREKHQECKRPADGCEAVVFFLRCHVGFGISVTLVCPSAEHETFMMPRVPQGRHNVAHHSSRGKSLGLCSARLQAGMCLIQKCPPEGGRYKNVPILGSHPHSPWTAQRFHAGKSNPLEHATLLTLVLNSTADDATRRIRSSSVLPDEVHLLQLPHGRVFKGIIRAVRQRGLPRDRGIPPSAP